MSTSIPQTAKAADTTAADAAALANDADMTDMRLVIMDSGELATRAAGLAADAAGHLRSASKELQTSYHAQRKILLVLLLVCGSLMLVAGGVFAALAWRLQARVTQLDGMVLAVGKRVVGMDASMESVGAVQEALQALLLKQEAIAALQVKIDGRLDEAIKSTQGMPELTAKQVDLKTQAMSQQVTAMDARLKAQAGALSTLSTQMKGLQGALGDSGAVRRELEAQARQQRDRQSTETAANAAAAAAARKRDSMLQYPRAQPADKP
ncbi:MAG: hypothetical protein Q7U05_15530 [Polaromonas sp.]|nr:hypothetical protein [Polaromonas sp.]